MHPGTVFDGMQLAARYADDSIQFVLGKQPAGQFPPSWDLGLVGMCVGERRQLDVPRGENASDNVQSQAHLFLKTTPVTQMKDTLSCPKG